LESYDPFGQDRTSVQQESVKGSSFRQIKVRGLQQEQPYGAYTSPQYGAYATPQQTGAYVAFETENDSELRTQPIVSKNLGDGCLCSYRMNLFAH
jgi:hypothetical protein